MTLTDLIIPPQLKIAIVAAAIIGVGFAGWTVRGWKADAEINGIRADIAEQREQAIIEARADERKAQEKVNEALRTQNKTLAGINARLDRDIDWLRKRPERPAGVSEAPRPDCTGANGAELSGLNAQFLTRYAAIAARIDAALATCYATIDATEMK